MLKKEIEFFGFSGSGKTTLSKIISKEIKIKNYSKSTLKPKYISKNYIKSYLKSLIVMFTIYLNLKIFPNINNLKLINSFSLNFYYSNIGTSFSTGHGFIQILTQNNTIEIKLIKNKKFLKKLTNKKLKNRILIYVENNLIESKKRAEKRLNKNTNNKVHSKEKYILDNKLFNIIKKEKNVLIINNSSKLTKIKINKLIKIINNS